MNGVLQYRIVMILRRLYFTSLGISVVFLIASVWEFFTNSAGAAAHDIVIMAITAEAAWVLWPIVPEINDK